MDAMQIKELMVMYGYTNGKG